MDPKTGRLVEGGIEAIAMTPSEIP